MGEERTARWAGGGDQRTLKEVGRGRQETRPVISALVRLRQEDCCNFKTSLGYRVRQ